MKWRRRPLCLLALAVAAVIFVLGCLGVPLRIRPKGDALAEQLAKSGKDCVLYGVVEETEQRDDTTNCLLRNVKLAEDPHDTDSKRRPMSRVRLSLRDSVYYPAGTTLRASGTLEELPRATNPGQFDAARYYRVKRIGFRMWRPSLQVTNKHVDLIREGLLTARRRLQERLKYVYRSADAGILGAMMLGEKSALEEDDRRTWQLGGISHMLAISGLHLTLIGMGLFRLLRRLGVRLRIAAGASMGVLIAYATLTGCSISTMRALIMFLLAMGAPMLGRTYDLLTALALAVLVILLGNPYQLFSSAFQLSASAVLICGLFGRRSKLTVAMMLYLGMLPVVLSAYFEIPLYSIGINFLVVPLLPAILGTGCIGCLIGRRFAGIPAALLLHLIRLILKASSQLPYASIILGKPSAVRIVVFYLLLAGWAYLMKRYQNYKRRLLVLLAAPLLVVVLGLRIPSGLKLTFLDVGQGDSCLIECPNGASCLVDGGSSSVSDVGQYRILPAVKSEGIRTLDYVVLTHMDADHINGVREILELIEKRQTSLRIRTVLFPYLKHRGTAYRQMEALAKAAGCRVLEVRAGDAIGIGKVKLSVLNPDPSIEGSETDENGQCVVLGVHYGAFDALLTGDVHGDGETQVLSQLKQSKVHYEVLKVAHHGSRLSTPTEFLEAVKPNISVISVGAHNRYHHPGLDLLKRLRAVKTKILRTDERGAVTVESNGTGYRVRCFVPRISQNSA